MRSIGSVFRATSLLIFVTVAAALFCDTFKFYGGAPSRNMKGNAAKGQLSFAMQGYRCYVWMLFHANRQTVKSKSK